MQKVNLLFVITKLELGGAQKQLLSLASRLDKEKFQIHLFTAKDGLLLQEALSIRGLKMRRSPFLERPINPLFDLLALIEIYWFIKKNNIEVVHTHSSKAGILGRWAARLAGTKIILHTVHGWSFHGYQNILARVFCIWLERLTAQFTDKLIVVSDYDRQEGLRSHIGIQEKYSLIRYGIDFREFSVRNNSVRTDLGINLDDLVVGMVSCLKPQKSPQDFIKLVFRIKQNFSNTKFLLVGDGFLRKETKMLISMYGLQRDVILFGWRQDVPRILSAMDIFVLTSLWEGLPIAVLEAMSSSLPVVATNTGGIREVVREGINGFLVEPHDIERMLYRVTLLLKNCDLRLNLGKHAKDSLGEDFSLENMLKKSEHLYIDLIRKKDLGYVH